MIQELRSSEKPFAFEQIARELGEAHRRFQEAMGIIAQLPPGDAPGVKFAFRIRRSQDTKETFEARLGERVRSEFQIGEDAGTDREEPVVCRADVCAEIVGDDRNTYRLSVSRLVIGPDLVAWEMSEIGRAIAEKEMEHLDLPPDAYVTLTAVDEEESLVHIVRLRSAVATPDQFSTGFDVWAQNPGRRAFDMGEMATVWAVIVEPYSGTIVEKFVDGEDNDL